MSNLAIQFDHVGKLYRLGQVGTGTLSHDLNRWWATKILHKDDPFLKIGETNDRSKRGNSEFVWALRDITFDVEQGDVIGIIGRNGAGKSTLLKLLSQITSPTTGTIRAKGRIGSLLEVGTGFHPEMTGRENIFMNGCIMGMTHQEISRKLDEIVDFAGVERYLDTPVKRYSSGMTVRLGFAISAFMEPEILVVDEVLSVGDAEFQKKAIGKMRDVSRGEGRTVLFVSHNLTSVRHLCHRGILIENGRIKYDGDIESTINQYIASCIPNVKDSISDLPREQEGTQLIRFTDAQFLDKNNQPTQPTCGKYLKIRVHFIQNSPQIDNLRIAIDIRNLFNEPIMSFPSEMVMPPFHLPENIKYMDCIIEKLPLTSGNYILTLWASSRGATCDWIICAKKFFVENNDYYNQGRNFANHLIGKIVLCDYKWEMETPNQRH